jgi:hypothetical protein
MKFWMRATTAGAAAIALLTVAVHQESVMHHTWGEALGTSTVCLAVGFAASFVIVFTAMWVCGQWPRRS